jgi:hypothetical protein
VRTTIGAVRSGGAKNCALPLESEHESRLLKFGFSQLYPAFETGSVVLVECH